MSTDKHDRLEEGKKRLSEMERRIERFTPKVKVKDGVKRGEWRSADVFIRGRDHGNDPRHKP